jgi:hypothetical protein
MSEILSIRGKQESSQVSEITDGLNFGDGQKPGFHVPTLEKEELMAKGKISAWSATRVRSESRRRVRMEARIIAKKANYDSGQVQPDQREWSPWYRQADFKPATSQITLGETAYGDSECDSQVQ